MGSAERRRLIVTADDFGQSASINSAVALAHREGILTCASLMVNEKGFEEAVEIAKANPRLGVGLHLTLCCGHAALSAKDIPDLINEDGTLPHSGVAAGFAYYFSRELRRQVTAEIEAQFEKFEATGLKCDHVNGHLSFHLHPVVLPIVIKEMRARGIKAMRLTRPSLLEWELGSGRWLYRTSHWQIFKRLSRRADSILAQEVVAHTDYVFGLLEDSRVNEKFVLSLLRGLPTGSSELYSHPNSADSRAELDALTSPRVKATLAEQGIELIRYADL
ncbi:MAG TPA: hopanoid biosynthesis-associated protein HpnK [Verrucomicrobiae bacterium]